MSQHIVRSYDAEFVALDQLITEIGGHAERLLTDAFGALERRDSELAEATVVGDRHIDDLERRVQERAVQMIARRQPMANDLRHIMTVMRIASDLERIGDLAKNIAKRAVALAGENRPHPLLNGLRHMAELARGQLKDVLDALGAKDPDRALAIWHDDERLDGLYNSVLRELLTYMMEDPRNIGLCVHLLFAAKNLERIGDHTTNIAENIVFLVTGRQLAESRPKGADASRVLIPLDPETDA
jgi:phosphate transport system protein